MKGINTTRPNVYAKLRQILPNYKIPSNAPQDQISAMEKAKKAILAPPIVRTSPMWSGLIQRLRDDGGDKIMKFSRNFIHIDYTRFVSVCGEIKGLSLNDALLQLAWNQKNISHHVQNGLEEFIVLAKEEGFNLDKTYIAHAYIKNSRSGLSYAFVKKCLRGRGRYGATPHPKTAKLEITFQERENGFTIRDADPLEWIRSRLRDRKRDITPTASDIYATKREKRPVKEIFC